jgi:hypothetical protein
MASGNGPVGSIMTHRFSLAPAMPIARFSKHGRAILVRRPVDRERPFVLAADALRRASRTAANMAAEKGARIGERWQCGPKPRPGAPPHPRRRADFVVCTVGDAFAGRLQGGGRENGSDGFFNVTGAAISLAATRTPRRYCP